MIPEDAQPNVAVMMMNIKKTAMEMVMIKKITTTNAEEMTTIKKAAEAAAEETVVFATCLETFIVKN